MSAKPKLRREHIALAVTVALLLLATLPPLINLGRFQHRIAASVSRSIGRPVGFRSISFRLLPWPALVMQDFIVEEAPGFGYEPALRAPEIVATPRLLSLWRGRFELALVELSGASVNLVRDESGRWNVSSVLLQASRVPNAPTAQPRPGPALRFPFIEATGTRINFKRGAEKLPFSLLDADFSMSLASPEVWRLKLEAQPLRTDIALSANDTGTVRVEGDLHRASAFGAMPVALRAEWKDAALGQLTQLLTGRDPGWRALVNASARLTGDLDHLSVMTRVVAAGLHRQEFTPERTYTVDARCQGLYSRPEPSAGRFTCRWPLGAGGLTVSSEARPAEPIPLAQPDRTLQIELDRIPADVLAATAGLFRPGAPPPGGFGGELTGAFTYTPATGVLAGKARMPRLTVAGATPFTVSGVQVTAGTGIEPSLLVTAEPFPSGPGAATLAVSARLYPRGWSVAARGSALLANLQSLAAALRLPAAGQLSSYGDGPAALRLDASRSGIWLGGEPALTAGSVMLENTRWQPDWLPFPVDLLAATADLAPGFARWNVAAGDVGTPEHPIHFSGSAQVPLACADTLPGAPCLTRFTLETPSLDAGALQAALTGNRPELVQALLNRFNTRTRLPALTGSIHAGTLTLSKLEVRDATASISTGLTPEATVEFHALDGAALGGRLHLQGTLGLAGTAPEYRLHAALTGASAAQAAALWGESWGPGTLDASADFTLSGTSPASLLGGAAGSFSASWLNGAPAPPLFRFARWDAAGTLSGQGLTIAHGSFAGTSTTVNGSIGWDRRLALSLSPGPGEPTTDITGALAKPEVQPPR